jgi:hypothetical protein
MRNMQEEMNAGREERKAEMKAHREEIKAMHEEKMAKLDAHHERMVACLGKTGSMDFEANPEEMQSETVHQKTPKKEAAAKSSGALKKRHRFRHIAAGRRGQPEERTRGHFGSRKKLATTGRKMTCLSGVAWRKVHIVRKDETRERISKETPKGRMFGKKCRPKPESIKGIRIQDLKKQLYMRRERTPGRIFEKTIGLEIAKRLVRYCLLEDNQELDIVEGSAPS